MKGDKKKLIYSILIIFFSVVVLTCNLEAATLSVGSNAGLPGDKDIPIPIDLSSAPGEEVCGFNFDFNFDISRLSFEEVNLGSQAEESGISLSFSQPDSDIVRIIVFGFNQNIIESGTVLNFTFNILSNAQSGKADLIINDPAISDCDPNANLLPVITENGEIIVDVNISETTTTTTANSPTTTPTTVITTTSTSTQPPIPDTTTTTSTTDISTSSTTTISSSTTTSVSQLWPFLYDRMWSSKKDRNLLLLRSFRDKILLNTESGRDYVFLLYDNSLEIAILLFLDLSSTKLAAEVINEILHGVESLLYNDEITISQKTINDFESLLNQLETKASPGLKTVINKVKKDIREEVIFKQLGIKAIEY